MCDDITCDDLHLAIVAGIHDITYGDLTYNDLIPECEIMGLGLMIKCVMIYILRAWLGWMI